MPERRPAPEPTALARRLARLIRLQGPMSVAELMAEANAAYYAGQEPIGAAGDFITAPEVSQMFGELLGLWCGDLWQRMGAPQGTLLVELGPGRGTLMADAWRALARLPGFHAAARPWAVETSPRLRALQQRRLAGLPVAWAERFEALPPGPLLLLANEFFDALPIRQFVMTPEGWRERLVDADAEDRLFAVLAAAPLPWRETAAPGAVREIAATAAALAAEIAIRIAHQGGAALIVDYGGGAPGDTLQAVRRHSRQSPFEDVGEADLSAHVDFAALGAAARQAGAAVFGPVPQGRFLPALGLAERARRLARDTTPAQQAAIAGQVHRLTDASAMGSLFQVMSIVHPALGQPAGFAP